MPLNEGPGDPYGLGTNECRESAGTPWAYILFSRKTRPLKVQSVYDIKVGVNQLFETIYSLGCVKFGYHKFPVDIKRISRILPET